MSGRKKVLYVITKSVWGGAQRYVFDLAANLPKDQFDITVAAGGEGPLLEKLQSAGIRTLEITGLERDVRLLKEFSAFWRLLKTFRQEKPDIIHLNSTKIGALGSLAAFFYKLVACRLSLVAIFTVHGWGFKEKRPRWQNFLIWIVSWFSSLFQNKIILINTADFETAQKFIPQKKLVLIPNGINLPNFLPREEARAFFSEKIGQNISPDTFFIGTVAELTKNKGLYCFIDALTELKTSHRGFASIVIGKGEDREKLQNRIRSLGLQDTVHLVGFLPDAPRYLKGLDAFVLPSLKEGLPYTIMEAMYAGLPIIATRVGGVPDLIKNNQNGLLVPPEDSSELAHAIRYIIERKDKALTFGRNSLDIVKTNFNLQSMIEKTIAIYLSK